MSALRAGRVLMIEQGGRGGVADYTQQLVRALAAKGWRVELASADDHRYEPVAGVEVHGVFHYVRGRRRAAAALRRARLGPLANGLRFLASVPRLMRLARGADVVHSQGWEFKPLGLLALLGMRAVGATIVQTSHNTFERGPWAGWAGSWQRATDLALALLCARTIVHARADLARVPRLTRGRAVVIPHGEYGALARAGGGALDAERARERLGIPAEAPVTLLFGQLRRDKGLADLLAALARVPELHLLVGGREEGALADAREQLADPRLAGRVTVREGFLEMAAAAELFAAADTVSLPYAMASQSGVLLLAYGFSRPVVVYPVGGLVEAVRDGETGWICARADVDALVDALADAVAAGRGECARRGRAGHELSLERYSWPAIAARTAGLYREALDRRVL